MDHTSLENHCLNSQNLVSGSTLNSRKAKKNQQHPTNTSSESSLDYPTGNISELNEFKNTLSTCQNTTQVPTDSSETNEMIICNLTAISPQKQQNNIFYL